MTQVRWKKASFSAEQTDCVELAHTFDAMRDSKNPDGPRLHVDVRRLVWAVKAERL